MFVSLSPTRVRAIAVLCVSALGMSSPSAASVEMLIDFSGFSHGDLVAPTSLASQGVSIVVGDNFDVSGSPDELRIFSTASTGGPDPDLQGPPFSGGGNLVAPGGALLPGVTLGNMLILQENNTSVIPNDEGRRPAGTITFTFAAPIRSFGFDLIDVENPEAGGGFFATFFSGASVVSSIPFTDFVARDGAVFANNSANRIAPIRAPLDAPFTDVEIRLGGSSAIDNIRFEHSTPEATAMTVWAVLSACLAVGGRRHTA